MQLCLEPTFLSFWFDVCGDVFGFDVHPFDVEDSGEAEEGAPVFVFGFHFDSVTIDVFVKPDGHRGFTREEHGEAKTDPTFIEPLVTGLDSQTSIFSRAEVQINGKVLVGALKIDDGVSFWMANHVAIESAGAFELKCAEFGYGFSAKAVYVGPVFDGEFDVFALFGKHDVAKGADVKKWDGVGQTVPHSIHVSFANRAFAVLATKSESFLHFWMKFFEFFS